MSGSGTATRSRTAGHGEAVYADMVPGHKLPSRGKQVFVPRTTGASRTDLLELMGANSVRFLRLQFTDIMGVIKNVEVPESQFEKALDGDIMMDGSSIEGFVRIEESDMLLKPDFETFAVVPWGDPDNRVARLICDVYTADEEPFPGDPRHVLRRQVGAAAELGYAMKAGCEAEFFLFQRAADGRPTTVTHDSGGYFDLTPVDLGEIARRDIVNTLEAMGFEVEAAHHEVAPGQHEVDFRYEDAMITADQLATFKWVVRNVALQHGLHATFMPKPIFGQNGSGMHTHQSLFRDGVNAFYDGEDEDGLSAVMRSYVAGVLEHAQGLVAVTNPLVNSYKRLVPGYEAPVNVAWSHRNRSPMVRIPARRGAGTRMELRMPDPAANPYLALAVQLGAGLDGVRRELTPPDPVDKNIFALTVRERRRYKIRQLPRSLGEAIEHLKKDDIMKDVLGDHVFEHFVAAKEQEWEDYISQVHQWEIERYLTY
ncbi:MAG TPA: type I glutamate--ammonia ligase [Longimicrobiales bacterium]|nr:type I glutamate--ammonia ligase [Longimicrobiales bacterium]